MIKSANINLEETMNVWSQEEPIVEETPQTEEEIIREVAEEEGMTYEEVKEMWEIFKQEAERAIVKIPATKPKFDKAKKKKAKKQAKASKKRNR